MEGNKPNKQKADDLKDSKLNMNKNQHYSSYLEGVSWARGLPIGRWVSHGVKGLVRLAGIEEAGLDAAEGTEHPAMLAPDLPLELIPLAGDHMEDFLQTWRVRDMRVN